MSNPPASSHYYRPPGLDIDATRQRRAALERIRTHRVTVFLHDHAYNHPCIHSCEAIAPPDHRD